MCDLNTKCVDLTRCKCIDLNVILNTVSKIKRNINTHTSHMNPNLIKTEKAIYKDFNHRVNYCKHSLGLSGDIEVNPGPAFVNPGKTIQMLLIVKVMLMSLLKMQVDNV